MIHNTLPRGTTGRIRILFFPEPKFFPSNYYRELDGHSPEDVEPKV